MKINIKELLKLGVVKAHADIVSYYMAKIQSVIVLITAFVLLFGSWFLAIGLFILLLILAIILSHFHYVYIYSDEQEFLRRKDPFMIKMESEIDLIKTELQKLNEK